MDHNQSKFLKPLGYRILSAAAAVLLIVTVYFSWLKSREKLPESRLTQAPQRSAPRYDRGKALSAAVGQLGLVPDLRAETGPFFTISRVVPGSPAEQFGFLAGDQLTAINGLTLQRKEDALRVLPELQLSDGLRIGVLRKEKTVEILVPGKWLEKLSGPRARPLADGKYEVTLTYRPRGRAKALYLAGPFNDWKPTALKMDGPDRSGRFTTQMVLNKGVYEYKFVLDGKNWEADPENIYQTDPYQNNLLFVGVEP